MDRWTLKEMPPQKGRSVIVTGTGGIGFQDALALTRAGADVILAGRNAQKGAEAISRIREEVPSARIAFEAVDLATLDSVRAFGARMKTRLLKLDLLINNAAVMAPPKRQVTKDGFELQFQTNYLGAFLLTSELLPLLKKAPGSRVVTVSSIAARDAVIDFDNLQSERSYKPMVSYGQSKLADLLFAFELQRRSEAGAWGVTSLAAHPGISRTDLITNGSGVFSAAGMLRLILGPILFQPAAQGALPTLFAATSPEATPGSYYGPNKMGGVRGFPTLAQPPADALDTTVAQRLWDISERLAHVSFGS